MQTGKNQIVKIQGMRPFSSPVTEGRVQSSASDPSHFSPLGAGGRIGSLLQPKHKALWPSESQHIFSTTPSTTLPEQPRSSHPEAPERGLPQAILASSCLGPSPQQSHPYSTNISKFTYAHRTAGSATCWLGSTLC